MQSHPWGHLSGPSLIVLLRSGTPLRRGQSQSQMNDLRESIVTLENIPVRLRNTTTSNHNASEAYNEASSEGTGNESREPMREYALSRKLRFDFLIAVTRACATALAVGSR